MAKWDLFVDESGSFDIQKNGKAEHNLVGGFIVPKGSVRKADVIVWNKGIQQLIVDRFGKQAIDTIN